MMDGVNDLIASYILEYKSILADNNDLTSNLRIFNNWRPRSYESGNIKVIFYDKQKTYLNSEVISVLRYVFSL